MGLKYRKLNSNTKIPSTFFDTQDILKQLPNNKSFATNMRYEYLKYVNYSNEYLRDIFSIIWILGCIPTAWNRGITYPLFKPGKDDVNNPDNYRCITAGHCMDRVFAATFKSHITPFIDPKIQPNQYGFRPNRETTDAVLVLKY